MEDQTEKKPMMKKYASMLQLETLQSKSRNSNFMSPTPQPSNADILEKVIFKRKNIASKLLPNLSTSRNQNQSGPFLIDGDFLPSSNDTSSRTSLGTAMFLKGYVDVHFNKNEGLEMSSEMPSVHRQNTQERNRFFMNNGLRNMNQSTGSKERKSKYISVDIEKEYTLKNLYQGAKEVSNELKSIVTKEYDSSIDKCINNTQIQGFNDIQNLRFTNVTKIIEKNFVETLTRGSPINQEIWKIVLIEINSIKAKYEEFQHALNKIIPKVAEDHTNFNSDVWEGLRYIIEYSRAYREDQSARKKSQTEDRLTEVEKNIYDFKSSLRSQKNVDKNIMEIYEMIEDHISLINKTYFADKEKYDAIQAQNDLLFRQYKEFEEQQNVLKTEMFGLIDQKSMEANNIKTKKMPMYQQKFFDQKIEELEKEINKLSVENEKLLEIIRAQREENKKAAPKIVRVKKCHDKGIMVNLYSEATPQVSLGSGISSYLKDSKSNITGIALPTPLVFGIINLIYTEKMIMDIYDDAEKRPRKTLNNFVTEWFFKRFGLYTVAEQFTKDFIFTLKSSPTPVGRYETFLKLIGIEYVGKSTSKDATFEELMNLDLKTIKKKCYATSETFKQFFKMISSVKKSVGGATHYGPLLGKYPDYIKLQLAKDNITQFAKEQNMTVGEIEDLLEEFTLVQEYDLYLRIEGNALRDIDSVDHESEEAQNVSVDLFANFMLDILIKSKIMALETIYTSLKANIGSSNEENLTYDEFRSTMLKTLPQKSKAWGDHAFTKLMDTQNGDKVPLNKLLPNLIENYFDEDQAKGIIPVKIEKKMLNGKESPRKSKRQVERSPRSGQADRSPRNGVDEFKEDRNTTQGTTQGSSGHEALEEEAIALYDTVSSLAVLQELYRLLYPTIKAEEKFSDSLHLYHTEFRKEINALPSNLTEAKNIKELQKYKKKELIDFLERLWKKLRLLVMYAFRK